MGALHYWRDIWRYRELFFFLAWRDILVRYKQTAIVDNLGKKYTLHHQEREQNTALRDVIAD